MWIVEHRIMKSWAPETDGAARGGVHPAAHHRRHRCRRRATEPNGLEANYPHKDYSCEMSVWKRDIHPYCTMQNMQDSFSVTASQQWRSVVIHPFRQTSVESVVQQNSFTLRISQYWICRKIIRVITSK